MTPQPLIEKARVLLEALPYIQRYSGRIVVVKYGGHAMSDGSLKRDFVRDIVLMHYVGMRPVVVHGGGPQITELMQRLDQRPQFLSGYRVTGAEELDVVRMVMQKINKDLVSVINNEGGTAVGISGEDANLLRARKMTIQGGDLGYVGEIERVDPQVITALLDNGFVPVVAGVGVGQDGQAYNINADHVAGAIASALKAEKLVYLTDVEGLYENFGDEGTLLSRVTTKELQTMLETGRLHSGMIPKIASCIEALEAGVNRAHILDGRVEHAVLLEIFTDSGVGTMVVKS